MSTTLMPETPAPMRGEAVRYPVVFANLLPDEVIAGRRARRLQQRILVGLGILLVVLVGWYGLSVLQTSNAKGDLAAANRAAIELQHQQRQFAPLISAQQQSAAIKSRLGQLMAGDIQWSDLLGVLRSGAPQGIDVNSVTGTLTLGLQNPADRTGGLAVLNRTGKQSVGSLTVGGTAGDKDAIASYVEGLAKIPGLAAPFPASVTEAQAGLTFSVIVILTTDILGGRYASASQAGR